MALVCHEMKACVDCAAEHIAMCERERFESSVLNLSPTDPVLEWLNFDLHPVGMSGAT